MVFELRRLVCDKLNPGQGKAEKTGLLAVETAP
jgi:hypothetical protein